MSEQRIIVFDSTNLNTAQRCMTEFKNTVINKRESIDPPIKRTQGTFLHKLLELYYNQKIAKEELNIESIIDEYRIRSIKEYPSLEGDHIEAVIEQFREYCDFYRTDEWTPLKTEVSFTKVMYEDAQVKLVSEGKMDLIAQTKTQTVVIVDHKRVDSNRYISPLSNQFMNYAWATGVHDIIVNRCGTQKTLPLNEKFNRHWMSYPQAVLDQWVENTIQEMIRVDQYVQQNYFPMNLTSCTKFNRCMYHDVCSLPPDSRDWKLKTEFREKTDDIIYGIPEEENGE